MTWFPNGSYYVSDIEDFFDITKKNETLVDKPPIKIYVKKFRIGLYSRLKPRISSVKGTPHIAPENINSRFV